MSPRAQTVDPFRRNPAARRRAPHGFTLIELILVMVILTAAVALAAPRLAAFFRGRALDSEARRILALTRYAQDRAASEGVPIRLWFRSETRQFGVSRDASYETEQNTADEHKFQLGDGITLQVQAKVRQEQANARSATRSRLTAVNRAVAASVTDNLPAIRFLPEGLLDPESLLSVSVTDAEGYTLTVSQDRTRMYYEITAGATR